MDLLRGACLANGVAIDGRSYDEIRTALGNVLVDKMLGSPPTSPPATFGEDAPKKEKKEKKEKKQRVPSAWHQFAKLEKLKVREGRPDLKGREVLAEIARRWKLQKVVNTKASPLMLKDSSSSSSDTSDGAEGLAAELLATSTAEEINANMQADMTQIDDF